MTLWEVDIHPAAGQPDLLGRAVISEASDLGLGTFSVQAARGFLVQGRITAAQIEQVSRELLADLVVEKAVVGRPGEPGLSNGASAAQLIHVLPKPGVTDPVAASALAAIRDLRIDAEAVVTLRKFWITGLAEEQVKLLAGNVRVGGGHGAILCT